jgi:hypothetical protein
MPPVRAPVELILVAAGSYCLVVALLLWWLGVRAFLRKFWEQPSTRYWGPAVADDYLLARSVARKLRWTPLRLRVFELLLLLGFMFLTAAALLHYRGEPAALQEQGRLGWESELQRGVENDRIGRQEPVQAACSDFLLDRPDRRFSLASR